MAINISILVTQTKRLALRVFDLKSQLATANITIESGIAAVVAANATNAELVADKGILNASVLMLTEEVARLSALNVTLASNDAADAQAIVDLQASANIASAAIADAAAAKEAADAATAQAQADATNAIADAEALRVALADAAAKEAADAAADAAAQAEIDAAVVESEAADD
jgi:hypothetical protein